MSLSDLKSEYECFDVSVENNIGHIKLNNPEKRNAMKASFWEDLPEIVQALDGSGEIRVIVISSTGPIFCAGLDIASLSAVSGGEQDLNETQKNAQAGAKFYYNVLMMQECASSLENCRVPVLAAIQGGCIGGGVDLVTACDMRYGTADSYFTIFEIEIGMTADVGTYPRVMNVLPEGIVRELSYTGRKMHADEAHKYGLINAIYDDHDTMMTGVMEMAMTIASKAPMAIAGCKRMITYGRDHTTADTLDYIAIWNGSFFQQSEIMEAMGSRQMKRKGNFTPLPKAPTLRSS